MCDPVTVGYMIVTVATTALSIDQQNDMAKAAAKAAQQAAEADNIAIQEQQRQQNQQSNLEQVERQKQAMRERARLTVAMGEGNISGNSPMREMANSFLQESYDMGILKENKENQQYNIRNQQEAIFANAQSRINEANAHRVSPGLAALQIGSSAASGYMTGKNLSKTIKGGG